MSLLTVVQRHCQVHNLNVPVQVVGSSDPTVTQILGLCNNIIEDFVDESKWQAFTGICTWTLTAAEDQGDVEEDIIGANAGYLWLNPGTFYDRTLMRPLYGPVNDVEWEALKAIPNPGPWYKFRILGNRLLINPIPSASSGFSTIAFEYSTSFGVKSNTGTLKATFTADSDRTVYPEKILRVGLAYYWKRIKQLPFDRDEKNYYDLITRYMNRDKPARSYSLDDPVDFNLRPGIFVPSGNWNL